MYKKKTDKYLPSVSVLMPVYNVEKYVKEAIDSILTQTYADLELIILDDCSTDNTAEIIKSIHDKRIIYHKNETNLGLANNLNVGLSLAKGSYIARMDGDDISLPDRLQIQVDFLETHSDVDLCSCALEMFGNQNTVWIRESDPEQVKITMLFYSPVLHATSVWRKDSFEKNKLFYNQDAFPAEDYDLWSRAVFYCKLANIPQVLYKYRIHGIQITKIDNRAKQRERDIKLRYLEKALPSLMSDKANEFLELFNVENILTMTDVKVLKPIYENIIFANKRDLFFQEDLLEERLKKHYQFLLFEYLKKNKLSYKDVALLSHLRFLQVLKLFHYWCVK